METAVKYLVLGILIIILIWFLFRLVGDADAAAGMVRTAF